MGQGYHADRTLGDPGQAPVGGLLVDSRAAWMYVRLNPICIVAISYYG
jgi:hypothetical protein